MMRFTYAGPRKFLSVALLLFFVVCLSLPGIIAAQSSSNTTARHDLDLVKTEALEHASSTRFLKELSGVIGPRMTGSSQDERAGQWALQTMRSIGLHNVHAEPWQLERGWRRGFAHAQMLAPFTIDLSVTSFGWTGSTPKGGVESEVVFVDGNDLAEEIRKNSATWTGKILLLGSSDPKHAGSLREISEFPSFLSAAMNAGAIAVIRRSGRPGIGLQHTDPITFPVHSVVLPVLGIGEDQHALMTRVVNSGAHVRLKLDVQNEFTPGEVTSNNIVGEIPGTEFPEQIVALGAHLDSWDLATGSIDDGFGVAAILGAAKSIIDSGVKPKRTIRIILFTGEEEGLLGSRAYVRAHRDEMKDFDCAIILDWGNGPITKYLLSGHDEFAAPLRSFFGSIGDGVDLKTGNGYLTYTDAYAFIFAGVAAITPFQDSPDYSLLAHSSADTFDKVDGRILERDSAVIALSTIWITNYPIRLGTVWAPEKTAQSLDEQRATLQALGLWPFSR
jgi:carboxypeptidase Q